MKRAPPWDDECPTVDDLTRTELRDYLGVAQEIKHLLTDWEINFCRDLKYCLLKRRPTDNERRVLNKRLLRKLWDEDPRLWED